MCKIVLSAKPIWQALKKSNKSQKFHLYSVYK